MKQNTLVRKMIYKYIYLFLLSTLFLFVLSELIVQGSDFISNAINLMLEGETVDVVSLITKTGLIIIIAMVVSFFRSVCNECFSINIQKECKNITMESLGKAQYCFFEKNAGAIINKLTSDISDMGKLLSEILPDILQYAVMILAFSIAIIKMNWMIFGGILVIFPIAIFLSNKIAEKINELAKKRRGKYDELAEIALDNIEGIEVAKAYGLDELLSHRVKIKSNEILKNEYARNRYQALANGLVLIIKWIPTIICSLLSLYLVLKNVITLGELMAFLVLFGKISAPISELPFRVIEAKELMISVKRIENLINTPKEKSGNYVGKDIEQQDTVIEMKNVSFSYREDKMEAEDTNILKNIELTIKRGEVVAIVGASGAGKTTLLKLLCGFEPVVSGEYLFYGQKFSDWNINNARQLISYVPQDSYLFHGTVIENVAYGDKNINHSKVEVACKKAGIYQTIMDLPDKFDSKVGERGVNLSGGECQRLSIARALYKNAPVILLDEPTSALDEKTQRLVSRTIYEDKDKTVIVIAHRLSTIKEADRIYCMQNGEIVEVGSHEKLMNQNGVYAALYGREVIE